MVLNILDFDKAATLAEYVRIWNEKGWSPATSTNYSFRNDDDFIAISKSGVDKSKFVASDFLLLNPKTETLHEFYEGKYKSSAETGLHTALYRLDASVEAIVHTHSVYDTILSNYFLKKGVRCLQLQNYEVLKALGYNTHEVSIDIPIFDNTQDIAALAKQFAHKYIEQPTMKGYLIAGHGFYTWGRSINEAKRHLEAFQFLFECEYKSILLSK